MWVTYLGQGKITCSPYHPYGLWFVRALLRPNASVWIIPGTHIWFED
jgi:hypothetical protein